MGISRDSGRRETLFGVGTRCREVSGGLSSTADTGTVRAGGGKDAPKGTGGGEGMFVRRRSGRGLLILLRAGGNGVMVDLVDFGSRLESSRRLQQPTFWDPLCAVRCEVDLSKLGCTGWDGDGVGRCDAGG